MLHPASMDLLAHHGLCPRELSVLVQVNRQWLEVFLPPLHRVLREAAEPFATLDASALVRTASPHWPFIGRIYRNDAKDLTLKNIECLDKIYRRLGDMTTKDITIARLGHGTVCRFHSRRGTLAIRLSVDVIIDDFVDFTCSHDNSEPLNLLLFLTFFDDDHSCFVETGCTTRQMASHAVRDPWLLKRLRSPTLRYAVLLRLQHCRCKECSYWR